MKNCPACGSQYSDDTLSFCLQDGTPLDGGVKQSSIDTIAFSQPATVESLYKTDEHLANRGANTRQYQPFPQPPRATPRESKRRFPVVLAVAAPLLLVAAATAFGGWMYFQLTETTAPDPQTYAAPAVPDTPHASTTAKRETVNDEAANVSDAETGTVSDTVKEEIHLLLDTWKAAAESRDLAGYVSFYGEKVDYFDTSGASAADVREAAKKIFDTYEDIDIELTNIKIASDAGGNTATAVFDKEWSYEDGSNLVDGKAHAKLHFTKANGQWKIVREKFQKVYFIEE